MYRVKPTEDNPEASEVAGADISCLISTDTLDQAEEMAILKISGLRWVVVELEESYPVTEMNYVEDPKGLELYEQALIDKEVYTFHTYENEDGPPVKSFSQDEYDNDYELKEQGLENVLGKMLNTVGHAIIPFDIGGAVDMYYFPNHIKGTGFATMELLDPKGNGPKPNDYGTYELVAFTKHIYNSDYENDTAFNLIERRICGIFTRVGNFSFEAVLKPGDTCEVPSDDDDTRCLIFDIYQPNNKEFLIGDKKHHLLLCMEVFRSEMDYARANGSSKLFGLLKSKGFYPYSDLDRKAVV